MKKLLCILLTLVMILGLVACGSSSSGNYGYSDSVAGGEVWYEGAESPQLSTNGSTNFKGENASEGRKWILRMNMNAETEDLDTMLEYVAQRVEALNGYIEDQNIYYGGYNSYRSRSASLTARIPVENADAFAEDIGSASNVTSSSRNLEDVTLQYVATENRMIALQTEEARLLELMEMADDLSDLLQIESRLTDVRYELENITTQLRRLTNKVDYATINLEIDEVRKFTPVAEPTFLERITEGFAENLENLKEAAEDFAVWFISSLPTLVTLGVIAGLAIWILTKISKAQKRKPRKTVERSGSQVQAPQVPAPHKDEEK